VTDSISCVHVNTGTRPAAIMRSGASKANKDLFTDAYMIYVMATTTRDPNDVTNRAMTSRPICEELLAFVQQHRLRLRRTNFCTYGYRRFPI